MSTMIAISVVFSILAVSEIVAQKSRGRLSMFFLTGLFGLILAWVGLPADIWNNSTLPTIGITLMGAYLVSIGTVLDLEDLKSQWKTLFVGFGVVVLIVVAIISIAPMLIDRDFAYGAAPVVAGGGVAQIIMSGIFRERGLLEAEAFSLLILTLQSLIGVPVTSIILRKEAKRFIDSGEYKTVLSNTSVGGTTKERKMLIPPLPEAYQKPAVIIAKVAIVTTIAYYVAGLTGGKLNILLSCLIFGIIFRQIGFLEKNALDKANAFGLINCAAIAYIYANIGTITLDMFISMIGPMIIVFGLGLVAILIGGVVFAKVFKIKPMMGIAIGLTALYGMPATFLIPNEIAEAIGQDEEQVAALKKYLVPVLLVAGFATVTIASVVVVGFVAQMV